MMQMTPSENSETRLRALHGSLLGTAVGDALGLPAEGLSPRRARRMWNRQWRMRLVFGCGMLSDDTEHTYAVAQALSEESTDVSEFQRILATKLRWWFLALPAGIGMATARACIKLWLGYSPARSGVYSAGNGPAMRSAIIGAYFCGDSEKRQAFVSASTCLTHTDPKADAAAQAVAAAAACAANGGSDDEFIATLDGFSDDPMWLSAMTLLRTNLASNRSTLDFAEAMGLSKGVSGYALHTVPVALYAWLRHRHDVASALTSALDCGGDADTVGAIVGGIVGAGTGPDAIPSDWVNQIADYPLNPARLELAARALVENRKCPSIVWLVRLLRNMLFLIIVLTHGFRRLLPPY